MNRKFLKGKKDMQKIVNYFQKKVDNLFFHIYTL